MKFVLGPAHPGRIDHGTPGVGVFDEGLVEARIGGVGLDNDHFQIVGNGSAEWLLTSRGSSYGVGWVIDPTNPLSSDLFFLSRR